MHSFRPRGVLVSSLVVLISLAVVSSAFAQQRVRVGSEIKEPKKIKDVKPVYPEDAKAAGVQGIVIVETLIGTDGAVKEAKVLRSVAMLDAAALEAVIQWRYTPTLLNGEPVELVMTVTVTFTLSEPPAAAAVAAVASGATNPVYTFTVAPDATGPSRPVRVGGDIKAPKQLKWIAPKFPEGQRAAARAGLIVILEVIVGPDGRVTEARALRPEQPNAFADAALEAVRYWEYAPTYLNGAAVPIVMTVTVTFTTTDPNDMTCE